MPDSGGIKALTGATPEEVIATRPPVNNPANVGAPSMKPGDFLPSLSGIGPWFAENLPETYRLLTGGSNDDGQTTPPRQKAAPPKGPPAVDPDRMIRPPVQDGEAEDAPAPEAPTMLEELQKYKEMIDRLYGAPDRSNPKQDEADAHAAAEKQRTKLLAQLALASGVTASGGAGWEDIAKGFATAGGVYDEGFKRYQTALQESADRFADTRQQDFELDTAKNDAALGLFSAAEKRSFDAAKQRLDIIEKSFDAEGKLLEGDELTGTDPAAIQDFMLRRERGLREGRYIPPTIDVTS